MAARSILVAIALTALVGCKQLVGIDKDPSLAGSDAAIDVPVDMDTSACAGMDCGVFGCDTTTNTCRPAKVWVFVTPGAFFGDGLGGANARATADNVCFTFASQSIPNRACSRDRTRAILSAAASDTIASMAALYLIPPAEVHRLDDDVLVSNKWDDMVTPQTTTRAPFTSITDDEQGTVWTGFPAGASNCGVWTTRSMGAGGSVGHTTTSDTRATWLGTNSQMCNLTAHLACVCWSGGS